MIITGLEILKLINKEKLISNYIDARIQVQPAGFDLTLNCIYTVSEYSTGKLGFLDKELPMRTRFTPPFELEKGETYILECNEVVKIPSNVTAFGYSRSSLARMGVTLQSPVVDPGYNGSLEFLVKVNVPVHLEVNARFAQLIFHKHAKTWSYRGSYGRTLKTSSEDDNFFERSSFYLI